ncbi:MAG: radical SAM protein, partial [Lachnospiraceae bacterium]|nr:radical SAM protein [Lachnospiraceae bacterium]
MKMAVNEHLIVGVEKHSIAHKLHIRKGDFLVSVNGEKIRDIFDYRFLIEDEYIDLEIRRANGKLVTFEIEKDFGDDLGLEFDSSLMDDYRSCSNKCIFCFIDQMPPGMRETLYFKDDDSRLSFLQGNYVTLTNMKEEDIRRIIRYRMEPINISVHATDKDLRCRMLNNRFAGDVLRYINML